MRAIAAKLNRTVHKSHSLQKQCFSFHSSSFNWWLISRRLQCPQGLAQSGRKAVMSHKKLEIV